MKCEYQIGDLVHIPQSVTLLDCDVIKEAAEQFNIPSRIMETEQPTLGIITHVLRSGYIKVYCEGDSWSVRDESVYKL
jgi:hypothetical protein